MTSRIAKERESLERASAQAAGLVQRLGKKVAKAEKREDNRDLRRKIVAGAAILTMARKDPKLRAQVGSFLQAFAKRQVDRIALELDEPETFLERDAREAAAAEKAAAEQQALVEREAAAGKEARSAGTEASASNIGARDKPTSSDAGSDAARARPSSGATSTTRVGSPAAAASAASNGQGLATGAPSV